ncbi:MAG: hypothetical protein Kow0025_08700 [Thermodesulfovibrionales bacterium]
MRSSARHWQSLTKALGTLFCLALLAALRAGGAEAETHEAGAAVNHEIEISIEPSGGRLSARDLVTVSPGREELVFQLHSGLNPSSPTPGVRLERISPFRPAPPFVETWAVRLPPGLRTFAIEYAGVISHPLEAYGKEYARGFSTTMGTISEEGVYLAGSSFWYPALEGSQVTFALDVSLPPGWESVSQGDRAAHSRGAGGSRARWLCLNPQEEIFLVAGRFSEYSRQAGAVKAMVFLRSPDRGLAEKYLEATGNYIAMYEGLIGPYPYGKFALVENFWETGFGMPSFTLLGPTVIRLPFILHTSYPHEILHNWWGNGVYPDYERGNWSEGLTAYLSDHLLRARKGEAAAYRQETLQKYADYVKAGRDFPLTEFRSRHSSATEAVGYGKSLMLFHMLRVRLGDEAFVRGLREFYGRFRFRLASFDDIREVFESVSGAGLREFFSQWVERPGAPELEAGEVSARKDSGGYLLRLALRQRQPGPPYSLRVPVAVTMEGRADAHQEAVLMEARSAEFSIRLPARPLRVDVDPEYDVFRRLHQAEVPPALTEALGSEEALVILPSSGGEDLLEAYRGLAGTLGRSGPDKAEAKPDRDMGGLPAGKAAFVVGWDNRFLPQVKKALAAYGVEITDRSVTVAGETFPRAGHAFVLAARDGGRPLVWIAADQPAPIPGLGRKLPHYHKYSYLVFRGDEPENAAKGRWPVLDSPMTVLVPHGGRAERVGMGRLSPRKPLAELPEAFSRDEMMKTISYLSSPELEGRGVGTGGLAPAAEFVARKFREAGLEPAGDGGYFQGFEAEGPSGPAKLRNVVGVLPGRNPKYAGESVVVGAHYDHLGRGWPGARAGDEGRVHPGADDNSSGVAVLLELARVLAEGPGPERAVVFVAFSGEEAGRLGSRHYIGHMDAYPASRAMAMVNLDTVGRLGGGKLLVLGAETAGEWVHIMRGAGYVTGVQIETVGEPLDSSDQVSFHEAGVPAVQLFTGPHLDYHRPSDTAEKIDYDGLVSVARVAREAIAYLAGREAPLEASLEGAVSAAKGENAGRAGRKVSLGTIPDFTFVGEGCRISGVVPGSPAEKCGLREGDIIVAINSMPVSSLKDLSEALKSLSPGDLVTVTFIRDGAKAEASAVVEAR